MKTKGKPKLNSVTANRKRREILDWARDHNVGISPGVGYDYYIESFDMFGYYPCDPKRKCCPCPESIKEVKEKGHCLCKLFWRDHDFSKEQMILLPKVENPV